MLILEHFVHTTRKSIPYIDYKNQSSIQVHYTIYSI